MGDTSGHAPSAPTWCAEGTPVARVASTEVTLKRVYVSAE
jgi:hypothetical protein